MSTRWTKDEKWDLRFLRLAREISKFSKDPSTKVGALLVRKDRTVAALGFNGFARNVDDNAAYYADRTQKYPRVIHAEVNAMIHCRDPHGTAFTLYTYPFMSCSNCTAQMLQYGVNRFVSILPTDEQYARWGASHAIAQDQMLVAAVTLQNYYLDDLNEPED